MNILFLCVGNSARSQIAEALAKDMLSKSFDIRSASLLPSQKVHKYAIIVMSDIGINIAKKYNINYLDSIIGDVYADTKLNVYDVIRTSDIIFENQFLEKCDLNEDGSVTEDDINVLLNFIFN